ncbi:class I SAM-dependent methyltransferase [Acinetobacter terrae]|uniref:Class I SAM-dependent methyltransferase n=1 Tax=Acinetobacter terrae TaxID=2731247 RepID=A0A4R0EG48_9GAMM|nr:class I SAM-dependent methyltransferase [Acinetobacter terrae]TCB55209.1 class I SAM-dependent methyltransferase [Acinetobacter terrae]
MSKSHWENVYQTKDIDQVSWYQAQDKKTLELIKSQNLQLSQNIIDVGSGASILIDQLLEAGYRNLHVLDLSKTALQKTKLRASEKGLDLVNVTWLVDDVCTAHLPQQYFDLWHDRAVFHFMITEQQQEQYIENMKGALKEGGLLIMSTFSEDGPTQCSGLPIQRYSIEQLKQRLGEDFRLVHYDHNLHITPWETQQNFLNSVWVFKG